MEGDLKETFVKIAALVDGAGLKVRNAATPRSSTFSLVDNPYGERAIGRDDLKKRIMGYARNVSVDETSGRAKICLCYATPGCGKSDLLSSIYEDMVVSEDLVPVPVTFNDNFGLDDCELGSGHRRALSLRMIFTYFVDLSGLSGNESDELLQLILAAYPEPLPSRAVPHPRRVLAAIDKCEQKKKTIVLLLDELSRYSRKDLPGVVQTVKGLADSKPTLGRVATVVTGTAAINWKFYGERTFGELIDGDSPRATVLEELAPADAAALEDIGKRTVKNLHELGAENFFDAHRLNALVTLALSLTSGHHRSLEKIYKTPNLREQITRKENL